MIEETLLLATTNPGKISEIEFCLKDLPLRILSLSDLPVKGSFLEKGKTFRENARGKSLFYSRRWGGFTLAEDSGLEVASLQGAPGVRSARFSGQGATDAKNNAKVLSLMEGVPLEHRQARFVSCMVLSRQNRVITEIEESVDGTILARPRGRHGFGYDPIFFYPPLGKTFAELLPEEKNEVSHRGRALKKMKGFLAGFLADSI